MRPGLPPQLPTGPARRATGGDDLAWDAFRYVDGAMPAAEAARFEGRLLDDQAAREAVAVAVEALGALALVADEIAGSVPMPMPPRRARRFALPAGLASAAALLLAAGWWSGARAPALPTPVDVALAWTGLRDADARVAEPTPGDSAEPAPGDDAAPAEVADAADLPPERPVPSWMVAAVATTDAPDVTEEMGTDDADAEMDGEMDARAEIPSEGR